MDDTPYGIGSGRWPGASRVVEEAGELVQVLGKLIGTGGAARHWDGSDLRDRLVGEVGDLTAALDFFVEANDLPAGQVEQRAARKRADYDRWHTAGGRGGEQ